MNLKGDCGEILPIYFLVLMNSLASKKILKVHSHEKIEIAANLTNELQTFHNNFAHRMPFFGCAYLLKIEFKHFAQVFAGYQFWNHLGTGFPENASKIRKNENAKVASLFVTDYLLLFPVKWFAVVYGHVTAAARMLVVRFFRIPTSGD